MKRWSRDTWLALILFVLLAAVTAVSVIQETRNAIDQPTLASFSNEPEGARAFWLFLQESGFSVSDTVRSEFAIPEKAGVMLMLEPLPGITNEEWEIIDNWVEDGGTLVIAGWEFGASLAMRHYDVQLAFQPNQRSSISTAVPLMLSPPLPEKFLLENDVFLSRETADYLTHLVAEGNGAPVALSFAKGDGRVVVATVAQVFTNQGLQVDGYAELALNLVTAAAEINTIWFDEWHHGVRPEVAASSNWVRETPVGRALLYSGFILFAGLVLRGRIFGRPLPLPASLGRRGTLEYLSGLANLNRRAGNRQAILADYHLRLKRRLSQRYRLDPTLPDKEFVEKLASYDPNLEEAALKTLLAQLSKPQVSEHELIEISAQAAGFGTNKEN